MNYSVCVDALYMTSGKDVYTAIEELSQAGIKNMEFWTWWDKDIERMYALKQKYDLNYVGICTKFVNLLDSANKEEYLSGMKETIEVCEKLGIRNIITKPLDRNNQPFEKQYSTMVDILSSAVAMLEKKDITLLLEPVSYMEAPYTFLGDSTLGFIIVKQIGSEHFKLLYDIYHMQLDEGDVTRRLLANLDYVGHIHTAGSAQRNELFRGELNYEYIIAELSKAGYQKYVGLEYFPIDDPVQGVLKIVRDGDFS